MRGMAVAGFVLGLAWVVAAASPVRPAGPPPDEAVKAAFGRQGIRITEGEAKAIRDDVRLALAEARAHGIGNSKVDFAAVEVATRLGLDTSPGSNAVRNVVAAVRHLFDQGYTGASPVRVTPPVLPEWKAYFDRALGLWSDRSFMSLVQQKGFHPVKISWEDIGRYEGSVWGDRISDVGIWCASRSRTPRRPASPSRCAGTATSATRSWWSPPPPSRCTSASARARSKGRCRRVWPSWGSPAQPAIAT